MPDTVGCCAAHAVKYVTGHWQDEAGAADVMSYISITSRFQTMDTTDHGCSMLGKDRRVFPRTSLDFEEILDELRPVLFLLVLPCRAAVTKCLFSWGFIA